VEKRCAVKSMLYNERSSRNHCMVGCNDHLAFLTLILLKDPTVYDFMLFVTSLDNLGCAVGGRKADAVEYGWL
jgi:hypothetical protein